jgi:hypothetical protein
VFKVKNRGVFLSSVICLLAMESCVVEGHG